jgi:cyclase
VDHIVGNYYFNGAGIVISHGEVYKEFMVAYPEINPYAYAKEAVSMDDPEGESIFPDEETYFANCNKPTITFDGDMSIRLGNHTFELISTPGHTPGQIAVFVPEEKVVFTGDTIFNQCQTWLYAPGHGPVCTKKEIDVQKAFLLEWVTAVSVGVAKGWSKEECVERISFLDRFPVDIGQEYMGEHVTTHNVSALYDKLTGNE